MKIGKLLFVAVMICISSAVLHAQDDLLKDDTGHLKVQWWMDRASEYATKIEDSHSKAHVLAEIAATYQMKGNSDQAKTYWQKAITVANQIPEPHKRTSANLAIAHMQSKAGDTAGYNQTMSQMTKLLSMMYEHNQLAVVNAEVAIAYAMAGDKEKAKAAFAKAVKHAEDYEEYKRRGKLQQQLVAIASSAGMFEEAEALANNIWSITDRLPAQAALAGDLAAAGQTDKAVAIANSLRYKEGQVRILSAVGAALGKKDAAGAAAHLTKAGEIAETFLDLDIRARMLIIVMQAAAKSGNNELLTSLADKAIKASFGTKEATFKAWALPKIADAQGMANDKVGMDNTLNTLLTEAEKIDSPLPKAWAIASAANVQANYDKAAAAETAKKSLAVLEAMPKDASVATVGAFLATVQAKAGDHEGFKATIAFASSVVPVQRDDGQRSIALYRTLGSEQLIESAVYQQAINFASNNQFDEAKALLGVIIFKPEYRQKALIDIAGRQAKEGGDNLTNVRLWLNIRFETFEGRSLGALAVAKAMN